MTFVIPLRSEFSEYWRRFYRSSDYADDPGFRDVIERITFKGMFVAGLLGVFGALVDLVATLLGGKDLALTYRSPEVVVVWDKLAIIVAGVALVLMARASSGARRGRVLGFALLLGAALGILLDDFARGQTVIASNYLGIMMLLIAIVIPYRPKQVIALSFLFWAACVGWSYYLAGFYSSEWAMTGPLLVYMIVVSLLAAGISTLLYSVRYEQYRAKRRAEDLGKQVAAQASELRALAQERSRFFTNVSHEFRTPLSLVLAPVEDALSGAYGPLAGPLHKQMLLMQRSGLRLRHLIGQLLDLSKLEAGRMHLHVRPHDINKFLRYIVAVYASTAERKRITLTHDADDSETLVFFDADKMEQIVSNLVSNAIKFVPEGGTIAVSTRTVTVGDTPFAELWVRDSGPAISRADLPFLFDRFHQVDGPNGPRHVGTGIGLSLTKELVEAHGGTVWAESGEWGNTFKVRLPLGAEHLDADDLVSESSDGALASTVAGVGFEIPSEGFVHLDADSEPEPDAATILVVDDHADMREYLHRLLGGRYRVEEAADGVEGLTAIRRTMPDLIICDVLMPRSDGFALCRSVKSDPALSHMPVILLTARAEQESELEGLAAGADDYVCKPFRPGVLLARVENLIEVRQQLRQHFRSEVVVQPANVRVPSVEADFLVGVRDTVERLMANSNFGVEWLADEVGVSSRHLQRKLRKISRLSANGFINTMRLQRARQLLEQHAGNVAEVADAVGYRDASYFSKLFKQAYGLTPSAFMQSYNHSEDTSLTVS